MYTITKCGDARVVCCPAPTGRVGELGAGLDRAHERHLARRSFATELAEGEPERRVIQLGGDTSCVEDHEASDEPARCYEPIGCAWQLAIGDRHDQEIDVLSSDRDRARHAAGLDRDARRKREGLASGEGERECAHVRAPCVVRLGRRAATCGQRVAGSCTRTTRTAAEVVLRLAGGTG